MTDPEPQRRSPSALDSIDPAQKKNYGSAQAYVDEVRNWMYAAQIWTLAQHARTACLQQRFGSPGPQLNVAFSQNGGITIRPPMVQGGYTLRVTTRTTTTISDQYHIPPFSRRIFAECVDCVLVFLVKLIIAYLLELAGYIDFDSYDRIIDAEADLQSLIDITQGLFPLEILSKIVTSVVEALCISYGLCGQRGTTPGKYLFGLQVISCSQVEAIPGNAETVRVTVVNDRNVPFMHSFLRSLLKNLIMNFFFPISTVLYLFQFNRTCYDLAAKTIVVCM